MSTTQALAKLKERRNDVWISATDAAEILGCQAASLTNAASRKGTLGSIQYFWAGSVLKISVMSLIRFVSGGYPLREIFYEWKEE